MGLAASVAWGTTLVVARYLTDVRSVDPLLLATGRFLFASLFLLAYVVLTGRRRELVASMSDAGQFLLLGLLGVVALGILVFSAAKYTYSINAVLITNANGIFIASLAFLVGEKVPPIRFWGLFIGLAGCILVVGFAWGGSNDLLGGLLALGAALSWALYTLLGKAVVRRWGGLIATTSATCLGSVLMALITVASGRELVLSGIELWLILYLALVPTALAFVCWYGALNYVPANLIGPLQYVAPVLGIALGRLILGEHIQSSFIWGTALVFLGVWLATRPARMNN